MKQEPNVPPPLWGRDIRASALREAQASGRSRSVVPAPLVGAGHSCFSFARSARLRFARDMTVSYAVIVFGAYDIYANLRRRTLR